MATKFITGQVILSKDLKATLRKIEDKVREKALRKAVETGKPIFINSLKNEASKHRETGALTEAIGEKQQKRRGTHIAIIGARLMEFDVEITTTDKDGQTKTRTMKRVPWRYMHLVDALYGTITAAFESAKGEALDRAMQTLTTEAEAALKDARS